MLNSVKQAKLALAKCKKYSRCNEKVKIQLHESLFHSSVGIPTDPNEHKSRILKLHAVQHRTLI